MLPALTSVTAALGRGFSVARTLAATPEIQAFLLFLAHYLTKRDGKETGARFDTTDLPIVSVSGKTSGIGVSSLINALMREGYSRDESVKITRACALRAAKIMNAARIKNPSSRAFQIEQDGSAWMNDDVRYFAFIPLIAGAAKGLGIASSIAGLFGKKKKKAPKDPVAAAAAQKAKQEAKAAKEKAKAELKALKEQNKQALLQLKIEAEKQKLAAATAQQAGVTAAASETLSPPASTLPSSAGASSGGGYVPGYTPQEQYNPYQVPMSYPQYVPNQPFAPGVPYSPQSMLGGTETPFEQQVYVPTEALEPQGELATVYREQPTAIYTEETDPYLVGDPHGVYEVEGYSDDPIYDAVADGLILNMVDSGLFPSHMRFPDLEGAPARCLGCSADSRIAYDGVETVGSMLVAPEHALAPGEFYSSRLFNARLADLPSNVYGLINLSRSPFELAVNRRATKSRGTVSLIHEILHGLDSMYKLNLPHNMLHSLAVSLNQELIPAYAALIQRYE